MATLNANTRKNLRRSETRKLRMNGSVPAVLYGKNTESTPVSVQDLEFTKMLRQVGRNGIINLDVENGGKHQVMVYDLQTDVVKGHLLHIDFFEVDMMSELDADVAVKLVGKAPGEAEGGVLSHMLYSVSVSARPKDIPEEIEVDISELSIGDSIHISDLKSTKNFTFNNAEDETVVSVLAPTVEEEEPVEDEGGEPELVDGGSDEESEK